MSVFLLFWIVPWSFGERFALGALFDAGSPIYVKAFLAVWLTGWTAGGLFAIGAALLPLGREELRVAVGEGQVQLFQGVGRLGRTRRWSLHEVRGLQAGEVKLRPDGKPMPLSGGLQLLVADKPVRFGLGLRPEEALDLLRELQSRHSTFKPKDL